MDNKKVLITGINGFIGTSLKQLIAATFPQAQILGIDKASNAINPHNIILDLLDAQAVEEYIRTNRPDFIFHLAGVIYFQDWLTLYQGNVQTTLHILDAVQSFCPHCRIVIPGSAAEYGNVTAANLPITENQIPNPIFPYGVSKLWQTTLAKYYASQGIDVVIGRMFNLIGKGISEKLVIGAVVNQLMKIKRGQAEATISIGNMSSRRDFINLIDACNGLLCLALQGKQGEIYNVCSGVSVSIEKIVRNVIDLSGINVNIVVDKGRIRNADIEDSCGSNKKILSETGWQKKFSLQESLQQMISEI